MEERSLVTPLTLFGEMVSIKGQEKFHLRVLLMLLKSNLASSLMLLKATPNAQANLRRANSLRLRKQIILEGRLTRRQVQGVVRMLLNQIFSPDGDSNLRER
jgi:hypothetical protein